MVENTNLETGENNAYTYNGLDMRIRRVQELQKPDYYYRYLRFF